MEDIYSYKQVSSSIYEAANTLDVNSAKLHRADGKLVIMANTESKFELFQKSFKQRFNTELIPVGKDSWNFYANIDTISPELLKDFEEECECLYMNFFPQPYIEEYGIIRKRKEKILKISWETVSLTLLLPLINGRTVISTNI